jgi:hypothetical protein
MGGLRTSRRTGWLSNLDRFHPSLTARKALLSCVGLLLLLLVAGVVHSNWFSAEGALRVNPDLLSDYLSGRALGNGENPYAPSGVLLERYLPSASIEFQEWMRNPHTPLQVVVLAPLSMLDYVVAHNLWLVIEVTLLVCSAFLVCRELGLKRGTSSLIGLGAVLPLIARTEFFHGQVNTLLLLLFVLAWLSLRRGLQAYAGLLLGVAAAIKLFPLLMVVPLWRLRASKAVRWLLGTATVTCLVAAIIVRPGNAIDFLFEASPNNVEYWRRSPSNISLVTLPYRTLVLRDFPDPPTWLLGLAMVGLLAACIYLLFRVQGRVGQDIFWGSVPWIVLASPIAWDHYLLLVLPLIAIQVRCFVSRARLPTWWLQLGTALVLVGSDGVVMLAEALGGKVTISEWGDSPLDLLPGLGPMIGALLLGYSELGRRLQGRLDAEPTPRSSIRSTVGTEAQ